MLGVPIGDVRFGRCPPDTPTDDYDWSAYDALMHEVGHAFGVVNSIGGSKHDAHHPKTPESAMSLSGVPTHYCYPTPLDALAMYALYQTTE